jgi:small subunit ribosomal protein S18
LLPGERITLDDGPSDTLVKMTNDAAPKGVQIALCHNGRTPRAVPRARIHVSESSKRYSSVAKQRNKRPVRRRDRKGGPGSGRRKPCPYCKDKIDQVDYKDIEGIRRFISEKGKMRSRRITGACRRHQNQIARAVKRARELALLPYVAESSGRDDEGGRGGRGRRDRDDR